MAKTNYNKSSMMMNERGKLPPQALEVETVVLGALLLEKDAFIKVSDILKPEAFYNDANKEIYKVIQTLALEDAPIDILTVSDILKKNGKLEKVGGIAYLAQLSDRVASAAHIEYHARIIAQKYIQRELIRVSSEIQTGAYEDSMDVADLLDKAQQDVFSIVEGNIKKETASVRSVVEEAIKGIENAAERPDGMSGLPSGFKAIDSITNGWQKSDLVIVAARPSMGKTAFVLSMARNMALDFNAPIALFSLEMSAVQLVTRLIASETELGSEKLRSGKLRDDEWQQLHRKIKPLVEAPIFIDDTAGLSIFELRAKCRRLKAKEDIQCIVIDYLQLMTAGSDMRGNREQEVSMISRQLKIIAKELNIPVIALSQLNRGVEQRKGDEKKPMLSDLRESGSIEQDSDMVLFIHRPERYGITTDSEGNDIRGLADIIIAKHRNGAVGEVRLRFRNELAQFTDLEEVSPFFQKDMGGEKIYASKMNRKKKDVIDVNDEAHDMGMGIPTASDFDDIPPF
ncbi:MAG: replicative DNA helicase [Marinifilaceae bacterium]|jgi:replicative DNA helicase|nr:replicative DNA helicase [Marinifilaceae bacterium]